MKKAKTAYVILILAGCFSLFIFSFFGKQGFANEQSEDTSADTPARKLEAGLSRSFALRAEGISAYTVLLENVFSASPNRNVIIGKEGFLYFGETAHDYLGTGRMTDDEIKDTSQKLEAFASGKDVNVYLMIAPNKNSLYDHMPANYVPGNRAESNAERLLAILDQKKTINLFQTFAATDRELYYATDTHWNDEGALLAATTMLTQMGHTPDQDRYLDYSTQITLTGDLYNMLYPTASANESVRNYTVPASYTYLTNTRSTEQNYIETYNPEGHGSLVVYRDSFFNNMVTYFSNEYEYVIYDKSVPYDLSLIEKYQADTVLIEIAERNIPLLRENLN